MHCEDLIERITDYLEDALENGECERFEEHLVACSSCATYLEQMKATIRIAAQRTDDAVTDEARDSLRKIFLDWRSRRR